MMGATFLTAEWQTLAMVNFAVEPQLVEPFVPRGTRLDFHRGQTFLSVVGFLFLDTRVCGIPVPWHRNFEELNLRFYVVREEGNELRRGVCFIRELVPRWAVSQVARWLYNENYSSVPMRHRRLGFSPEGGPTSERRSDTSQVRYEWQVGGRWHALHMDASGPPLPLVPNSHAEFIAEHYWGYTRQRDGGTVEYHVEHPPWRVWESPTWHADWDLEAVYGPNFAETFNRPPVSAFLAEGSPIRVSVPRRLPAS